MCEPQRKCSATFCIMSGAQTFDRMRRSRTQPSLTSPVARPNATSAATLHSKLSGLTSLPSPSSTSSGRFYHSTMSVGDQTSQANCLASKMPAFPSTVMCIWTKSSSAARGLRRWWCCMMSLHKARDDWKLGWGGWLLGHLWAIYSRINSTLACIPLIPVCMPYDA